MNIEFLKMHGLGNDFIVLDSRKHPLNLTGKLLARLANRRTGIGCDQILVLEPGQDVFMRIYNADGNEAEACGNGTRCIAWRVSQDLGRANITVQTIAGNLSCRVVNADHVQVTMNAVDVLVQDEFGGIEVNVGNPHKIFFVDDLQSVDWGALCQRAGSEVNVGAVQVMTPNQIQMCVWERGVGLTQACGSGACAGFAAAHHKRLLNADCQVIQPGGSLHLNHDSKGRILMTGPVALSYKGSFNLNTFLE